MAVPRTTIWDCAPHTKAKHLILEKYLNAWFPILGRYHQRIIYMDGFAGPGEYTGGEKGSPIVALNLAKNHTANFTGELNFYFVENDAKRFDHLKSMVEEDKYPANFTVDLQQGEFANVLANDLDNFDQKGLPNAPIFAFIDPFGFSGVPYHLIHRLLRMVRTEVFVYFARNAVNRHLENDKVEHHMAELFGMETITIPKGPNRMNEIKNLYERRLKEAAQFVGSFTMIDDRGVPIYDLFFASNSVKGYVKMKEAMWSVDENGGFRFSDKDDPNQLMLLRKDPANDVVVLIKDVGSTSKLVPIEKMEAWIETKTVYLVKHLKAALRLMEEDGSITVEELKKDGSRRRGKTFAEGTQINFS